MCGIAGIMTVSGAPPEGAKLRALSEALSHRGPDGAGQAISGGVGLAHLDKVAFLEQAFLDDAADLGPDFRIQGRCDPARKLGRDRDRLRLKFDNADFRFGRGASHLLGLSNAGPQAGGNQESDDCR